MVSVKVCWRQTGKLADGKKVALGFDGLTRGVTRDEHTNASGEAHFEADPGHGKVYVSGQTVYTGALQGKIVVYI